MFEEFLLFLLGGEGWGFEDVLLFWVGVNHGDVVDLSVWDWISTYLETWNS